MLLTHNGVLSIQSLKSEICMWLFNWTARRTLKTSFVIVVSLSATLTRPNVSWFSEESQTDRISWDPIFSNAWTLILMDFWSDSCLILFVIFVLLDYRKMMVRYMECADPICERRCIVDWKTTINFFKLRSDFSGRWLESFEGFIN